MWLMAEYLPEVAQLDHRISPSVEAPASWLGGKTHVETVEIPKDTRDWTLRSFWAHPERGSRPGRAERDLWLRAHGTRRHRPRH